MREKNKPLTVEHTESEEDLRKDLTRHVEHELGPHDDYLKSLHEQLKRLNREISSLGGEIHKPEFFASITSDPPEVPDEGIDDLTPDPGLDARKDAAARADQEAGRASDESKGWTAATYLGASLTVAAVGASAVLLIDWLRARIRNAPAPGSSALDPESKKTLDALVEQWQLTGDSDYWNKLADYTEKHSDELSLGDHVVFMNITIRIGGTCGGFIWDNTRDQVAQAQTLEKAYCDAQGSRPAAMYRQAASLTYKNQAIPRLVMAGLLKLAFAWLGVTADGKETSL